jgi:hypothetical protein
MEGFFGSVNSLSHLIPKNQCCSGLVSTLPKGYGRGLICDPRFWREANYITGA